MVGWEIVAKHKYRAEMEDRIKALQANEVEAVWSKEEQADLRSLSGKARRAIHLQCANGYDTLFLLSLGIGEVVGVDISEEMITQAREISTKLRAAAEWYCCDVLETPQYLNDTADLVYTGGGALPWIMDIETWAKVVARLLRPGGKLYLNENHPLSFLWEVESEDYKLSPGIAYCDGGIVEDRGYPASRIALHSESDTRPAMRERIWPLGDVINSLISAGLVINYFNESNDPGWAAFPNMPDETLHRLPHRYVLHAEKSTT